MTEFVKYLSREGIVNVKEDEKDGLMIAWRDTSMHAVRRREEIRAQEIADAKSGVGEDKMMKRMAARAKEEAEAKAKAAEARNAAQMANAPQPAETKTPESAGIAQNGVDTPKTDDETPKTDGEMPKPEAAPVKISFGLKTKVAPQGKPGFGQMKSQSVFKRARAEKPEEKPVKKIKV